MIHVGKYRSPGRGNPACLARARQWLRHLMQEHRGVWSDMEELLIRYLPGEKPNKFKPAIIQMGRPACRLRR
jgi:hypothetical protein